MRIKRLKLALIGAVVADIIVLILEYPTIYFGAFSLGFSTYNVVELVFKYKL